MKIAVVGGGMMGLVSGERLVRRGHSVTIFDRSSALGGLCTWHDYGVCTWDKFYHVLLPSDRHLIALIRKLGLESKLRWKPTRTGYFVGGTHHSLSSNLEFLMFPVLSPIEKVRLAWTLIYGSRLTEWRHLENLTTAEWLIRHSGRSVYDKFWRPLLLAKLGVHHDRVSAVFIWSYIKRLFSARDPSIGREQLGYVEGGYRTVIEKLAASIAERGVVRLESDVSSVTALDATALAVHVNGGMEVFDKVLFTGPAGAVSRVVDRTLVDVEGRLDAIRYLGVICYALLTSGPLTPFYALNLADENLPFTGVIGMSNVVSPSETGGCHLTYFPRYLDFEDPLFRADDRDLLRTFWPAVKSLFPAFEDAQVVACHVNRARFVQPLQVLNFSKLVPHLRTNHPGLYLLNTGQFSHNTVNNNEVVRLVTETVDEIGELSSGETV